MKRIALAAVAVVALAGTLTANAAQTTTPRHGSAIAAPPYTPPPECRAPHFGGFARAVWSLDLWQRGRPDGRSMAEYRYRLDCAVSGAHRRAMEAKWAKAKVAYGQYRLYRQVADEPGPCNGSPRGPADGCYWAIPWYIVCGESHGDFYVNADGAYQIIPSTWQAHGGSEFGSTASAATPLEQHVVADRVEASSGTGAWYGAC